MTRELKQAASRYTILLCFVLISFSLYSAYAQAEELEGFEDGDEDYPDDQQYEYHNKYSRQGRKAGKDVDWEEEEDAQWEVIEGDEDISDTSCNVEGTENAKDTEYQDTVSSQASGKTDKKTDVLQRGKRRPRRRQEHYYYEALGLILLLFYGVNFWIGSNQNKALATAWAKEFARKDGIFARNFSQIGQNETDALLLMESYSEFKLYATGRRFCKDMVVTLKLKNRQDVLSNLMRLVFSSEDQMIADVRMNDDSMDKFVFAVAKKKMVKKLMDDERMTDLRNFAREMAVSPEREKKWRPDIKIISEFFDIQKGLIGDRIFQDFFSVDTSSLASKLFRSLHFSDRPSDTNPSKTLRFVFALPSANQMKDIEGLVDLLPLFIDLVGTFRLPPNLREKAEKARKAYTDRVNKRNVQDLEEAASKRKQERLQDDPTYKKKNEKRALKKKQTRMVVSRG